MKISQDNKITIEKKKADGEIVLTYYGTVITSKGSQYADSLNVLYRYMMRNDEDKRMEIFKKFIADENHQTLGTKLKEVKDVTTMSEPAEVRLERGLDNLIKFLSEFNTSPSIRMINTLAWKLHSSTKSTSNIKAAKEYLVNYFALSGNQYLNDIKAKIKSDEFNEILADIAATEPTKKVNTRIRFKFGAPGTGKTYNAVKEANNKCIVCHSGMLESDLMENFVFKDGAPSFEKSDLWLAMEKGEKIVLDEINLLNFQCLRFMQGITDNKSSFDYKGHTINIADGFEIIGTLNLDIGGMIYSMPEPLLDRASDIQEYKLTGKQLAALF